MTASWYVSSTSTDDHQPTVTPAPSVQHPGAGDQPAPAVGPDTELSPLDRVRLAGQILDQLTELDPQHAANGFARCHTELQSALAEIDRQ